MSPESGRQQHTGGNILKVSFIVLDRQKFTRRNGDSNNASRCVRCDPDKSRDVFVSLEMEFSLVP